MTFSVSADDVRAFAGTVTDTLGLAVSEPKLAELEAILRTRLEARGMAYVAYQAELEARSRLDEVGVLASLLTVSETFFFRHEQQLSVGIDRLIAWARDNHLARLRIASVGCASGEEPYSLVMMLLERFPEGADRFELNAVDVNPIALERARRGEYGPWSLRATPSAQLDRWFRRSGNTFQLSPEVRSRVRFIPGNLARDTLPVPAAQHAIFCRNALMYFSAEQYRKAVSRLADTLVPGGLLFLGHAETLRGIDTRFQLVSDDGAFYYTLADAAPGPRTDTAPPTSAPLGENPSPSDVSSLDSIAQSGARLEGLSAAGLPTLPPVSSPAPLALFHEERFDHALEALRSLPLETAQRPEMRLLEAVLLFHRSEWDAAESASRDLLLHPGLAASAHYLLALCCEVRARPDTAALHDQAAIGSDPSFSLPRLHLGRMLRRLGASERAANELVHARRLLEQDDAARLALFGAGLGRASLLAFCDAELLQIRREHSA